MFKFFVVRNSAQPGIAKLLAQSVLSLGKAIRGKKNALTWSHDVVGGVVMCICNKSDD